MKLTQQNFHSFATLYQYIKEFYFQNTFPFGSMFRQTDDIGKKRPTKFVEQGIVIVVWEG